MPEHAPIAPRLSRGVLSLLLRARNRHLFIWDALAQPIIVILAFLLRLETILLTPYRPAILIYALLALVVKLPIFYLSDMYRRYWRFASSREVRLIVVTAVEASAVLALLIFFGATPLGLIGPVPRSIPFLDAMLTVGALALPRLILRMANRQEQAQARPAPARRQRVLIVGAGEAGHLALDQIDRNPHLGLVPVGLVDDDEQKRGLKLGACSVLGPCDQIPSLVAQHRVERVIIAIPSADGRTIRRLAELCRQAGVEASIMPGMPDLLSGSVSVQRMREIRVEDLLRRPPAQIDHQQIAALCRGSRILVTGGGGSIGGEICRQLAAFDPAQLVVLGRGENSLYHVAQELREIRPDLDLRLVVADVRDAHRLEGVFARCRPDIVFHAAAHKHVPLMEDNVEDAVTNNILGTRTLLDVAHHHGVPHLVMISTDKAVHPTSVMGATKRVAEMLVQDMARRTGHAYVAVRFGNVLGSRGSVVPLFQRQIAAGGPITITHPDVRRYFMTIPEAVELVLQAAALGQGGEVFILDMGEPIRIIDLARDMIELSGLQPDRDIEIQCVGLRPGEKLFEELFLSDEHHVRSAHEQIFCCRNGCTLGEGDSAALHARVDALAAAARQADPDRVRALLHDLVPDYKPVEPPSSTP